MFDLSNKTALITGGGGAIGQHIAKTFIDNNIDQVMLVDVDEDSLKKATDELGDKAHYHVADVTNGNDVKAYVDAAKDKMGRIDVFCNNAGIEGVVQPVANYPEDEFDKVMAVNVKGVFLGNKHIFPVMQEQGGGKVIVTSSVAGLKGQPMVAAYTTSKHAVIGLMKNMALEGAAHGITCNSVHPAPVDNRMMRSLEGGFADTNPDAGSGDEVKAGFEQMIPMGRYAENDDVANTFLFLASDASNYMNGVQLPIDGGMSAT